MRPLITLCVVIGFAGTVHAAPPQVPTAAPYIVLSDNLDEPNGYGFCVDTLGRGKTDLLQTHSCKPAKAGRPRGDRDNDTRYSYDSDTGRIVSYAFEGHCMQALIAPRTNMFALLPCSDHPRQKFVYDGKDRTLRLAEDIGQCVSVASKTLPAGPWVKRSLTLQKCDAIDAALKQWTVVAK